MRSLFHRSLAASGVRRGTTVSLLVASSCALAVALPSVASAKTINLNDTGHLKLKSGKGLKLEGTGSASGTIPAGLTLHVSVVSTNKVSVEVTVTPKGGSLSGKGSGKYSVNGGTASFSGTLAINKGSGTYSKAKGNLNFNGTITRTTKSVTVHVSGKLSY